MIEEKIVLLTAAINRLADVAEKLNFTPFDEFVAAEQAAPEPVKPEVSFQDVRSLLATLSKDGKKEGVKSLLTSYGVSKLSEVPEKDYPGLIEKAGRL